MNFSPLDGGVLLPEAGTPRFRKEALMIRDLLADQSPEELSSLMKMSSSLGEKTFRELNEFPVHPGKPALFTYSGTSFKHLDPATLSREALDFAASRLSILSGLYGILAPFDLIAPYRLEMKTPLSPEGSKSLSAFWKPRITDVLDRTLQVQGSGILLNLASSEYTAAVNFRNPRFRLVSIHFRDKSKGGSYRTVGMYAKEARGRMLRHILEERVCDPEVLKEESGCGYSYSSSLSDPGNWVFIRD